MISDQHHAILGVRIGSVATACNFVRLAMISDPVLARALDGHHFHPPGHHTIRFRKEAVAAYIHAIALVSNRSGKAANVVSLFQHGRPDAGSFDQFECRRESPPDPHRL